MSDPRREQRLEELTDEFAQRLRAGEPLAVTDYVARYPDLAADLQPLCRSVAAIENLKSDQAQSSGAVAACQLTVEQLGEYRIVEEIGRGGMGIVYEAEQVTLGRSVALKVLPPVVLAGESQVERFRREAETASRLHHPDIVPIYAFGEDAGIHFFAMQRVDGVSLDRRVPFLDGPERWRRIARIGADVATAIQYAHSHGVLHRDIKPSNLLLESSGKVWVTDFGIAKIADHGARTRTGDFIGTLRYSAPEQLDGVSDARADVYGLGLTLFELATRRPAFGSLSRRDLLRQIRDGVPVRPRAIDPSIPRDLETVILTAIAYDPVHRYATAGELAEDLRRFGAGVPVRAREIGAFERLWRWSCRNRVTAALALSTAIAVVAAAGIGWQGFLSTRAALAGEQAAAKEARQNARAAEDNLHEARLATMRAESNLALSLRAFDDLFDTIVGKRHAMSVAQDDPLHDSISAAISDKDLAMLERTLDFYDEFAEVNAGSDALREQTARAFRRVGDIRRWVGDLEPAEAALRRALGCYEDLVRGGQHDHLAIEQALVHKSLGLVLADADDSRQSRAQLGRARAILEQQVDSTVSRRARLELARLYNTIVAWSSRASSSGRGGMRPPAANARLRFDKRHREAMAIAQEVAAEDPTDPEAQLLVARTHRLLAEAAARSSAGAESIRAIESSLSDLADLAERFPLEHRFRVELAEAYSTSGLFQRNTAEGVRRSREAVRHARELTEGYPRVAEFADALARSLHRLGIVSMRSGQLDAASDAFRSSLAERHALLERFPDSTHRRLELVEVRRSLARVERKNGRPDAARALLDQAILEVAEAGRGSRLFARRTAITRSQTYRELVGVLRELGEDELAGKAEREARLSGMRRPWRGRR